jgi:hypothetical protein
VCDKVVKVLILEGWYNDEFCEGIIPLLGVLFKQTNNGMRRVENYHESAGIVISMKIWWIFTRFREEIELNY